MTIAPEAPPISRSGGDRPPPPPAGPSPGAREPGPGRAPGSDAEDRPRAGRVRDQYWDAKPDSWRQAVLIRAKALHARATCPGHLAIQPVGTAADPALDLVDAAAEAVHQPNTLRRWWHGTLLERSWMCLHEAEALLAERESSAVLRARLPGLLAAAETVLDYTDPRLAAAREVDRPICAPATPVGAAPAGGSPVADATAAQPPASGAVPAPASAPAPVPAAELDARARHQIGELIRAVYSIYDERYARSRNFRNRLIRTFMVLVGLLVALVLLSAFAGHAPPFCGQRPATVAVSAVDSCLSHHSEPDSVDLVLVLLFGGIGGLLGALPSLAHMGGSWNRFGLPAWQAALKVPTGALTGLLGALLLNAGIAQLSQTGSPAGLLVTALCFGAAQQAVTRYVDRSTASLLAATPSKEEREHLVSAAPRGQPPVLPAGARRPRDGSAPARGLLPELGR